MKDSSSDVNRHLEPEMEEEKLETSGVGTEGKCEAVSELADSLDGKKTEAGGGEEGLSENRAAEGETEFIVDTAVETNGSPVVMAAEEGGGGMVAAESEEPPLEMKSDDEHNRVDDVEGEVAVTDTGDVPLFTESRVDELLVDMKSETEPVEKFAQAVDAKLETVVTDSEPRIDSRGDEMVADPQLETKADQEFIPVVAPKVEVVVNDVVDAQQLSEVETYARGDDSHVAVEEMEALDSKCEEQVSYEKNNERAGVDNQTVDSWVVKNNAEGVVGSDKVDEEKVDVVVNDTEAGTTGRPVGIEEEKVDAVITEEIPITGAETNVNMITEVHALVVDTCEQEQVCEASGGIGDSGDAICEHAEDKDFAAEESLTSGTKMAEDESKSMEALGGSMLDEPVNMAETKDAVVKEDIPAGDIEAETETGVELENVVEEDIQLADAEGSKETEVFADETQDSDEKMETEETSSDADEPGLDLYDSPAAPEEEDDEAMVAEEETGTQDTEMETETDIAESGKSSGGKRKRGKLSKSPSISKAKTKSSTRKTVGEDVCFICFDGGELVLCDRRGCPKAYHPSCVNRDEAFFRSKGRWNCGWHLCSICEKNARYMCYTCTFSLCKSCTKDAVILCVRGNKGFCETCMRTVKLIENNEQGNKDTQVDFDDRSSWEYLFKDYYIELKAKLSLSSADILEAKNPWKGADMLSGPSKQESSEALADANDGGSGSDDSIENIESIRPKRRKIRKQSKTTSREEKLVSSGVAAGDKAILDNSEWASKELLEFVSHMKDGDTSFLSQFDVQALLLEYIKRNKLRDPRRKSQIICDARLENLFGKPRVGHFEMLKLLESHFLVRDEQNDDLQGSVVDTENNQLDIDGTADPSTRGVKDRRRKSRKKSDRGPQSNLEDYAAIDMHNIGLIYLRRKLMEDLLEDAEMFHDKVIGTFVRIRISGSNQKQDLYRLVPVIGTSKAAEPYKIGKKSTDTTVEILNLNKTEIISIDTISNQEFTEEECKRLRQSIKCGLIKRMTVGEILDKTMEIQVARVNDWLESETLRLSHLRDRASDLGRRKELRECVEKLQLLKTPEERRRRLEEIPEIHADPKMDPSYESDDNGSEDEDSRRDAFMRSKGISRRGRGPISPRSDNSTKLTSKHWESTKYLSSSSFAVNASHGGEIVNENAWNLERDREMDESNNLEKRNSIINAESGERAPHPVARPESFSGLTSVVTSQASFSSGAVENAGKINESEKMWHYKDPSGKVQGPFSMVQLRKWNNTGYFPADLRIWRATENQDKSILLADALEGKFKFPKDLPAIDNVIPANNNALHSLHTLGSYAGKTTPETSLHQVMERSNVDQNSGSGSKLSAEKWISSGGDFTNLPSPTPRQSNSRWDSDERGVVVTGAIHQTPGSVNGMLSSPTPVLPNIVTPVINPSVQTAPFSPTPSSQQGTLMTSSVPSIHAQSNTTSEQPPAVSPHQVQMHARPPVASQNLGLQPGQPQGYAWGPTNVQNSPGNFSNSGTHTGLQPDVWRPTQSSQPNMPPPATTTPNASWGMGPIENNNAPVGVRPENPNMGWGPMQANPNMGWGNLPPVNTNMNWGPSMPVPIPGNLPPGNTNNQGPMPGYVNPGWGPPPPTQGPVMGNGWGPPGGNAGPPPPGGVQGPPQGNTNQGFGPSGNQGGGSWGGGETNNMGGQFQGHRGGQGRDSGFRGGGPRPWNNRQSSFGGRGFRKRDSVCPYNANGRCRKGMHCDYMHT